MLIVSGSVVRAIEAHGREAYPEEGCGFLLGPDAEPRRVAQTRRATNAATRLRKRRYIIDPLETLGIEKSLRGTKDVILGFYHSHPDHPAIPSGFDREAAWPWYSYLVVSVRRGVPDDMKVWTLEGESRAFKPTELRIEG